MKIFKENVFNIPNTLSSFRILIIIPFVMYFLSDNYLNAAIFLGISGLSDLFDGIIARKLNQITRLGKILDPVADKLTLAAVIFCMGIKFSEIRFLVTILILKDVSMLLAGSYLLKKGINPPAANWYGKLSTVFFYISAIIIVGLKAIWAISIPALSVVLLTITSVLMLFALYKYFIIFKNLINEE